MRTVEAELIAIYRLQKKIRRLRNSIRILRWGAASFAEMLREIDRGREIEMGHGDEARAIRAVEIVEHNKIMGEVIARIRGEDGLPHIGNKCSSHRQLG